MGSRGSRAGTTSRADRKLESFLQNPTILDTSDGSTSIYDMKHEEGFAITPDGQIFSHVRGGKDEVSIPRVYDARGGIVFHTHPIHDLPGGLKSGVSFSPEDLLHGLSLGTMEVITTSNGRGQRVRVTADFRGLDRSAVRAKVATYLGLPAHTSDMNIVNRMMDRVNTHYRQGSTVFVSSHKEVMNLAHAAGFKVKLEVIK